jgi:hypothetical protein
MFCTVFRYFFLIILTIEIWGLLSEGYPPSDHQTEAFPEAKFLDVIGTKVLRAFLLPKHSQLYIQPHFDPPPPPRAEVL